MKSNMLWVPIIWWCTACTGDQAPAIQIKPGNDRSHPAGRSPEPFVPDSSYVEYWCSKEVLDRTERTLHQLDLSTIAEFLAAFNRECCRVNDPFADRARRLLIEVAQRRPGLFLQLLYKNNSLDKALVLEYLAHTPAGDNKRQALLQAISAADAPKEIIDEVLAVLRTAPMNTRE